MSHLEAERGESALAAPESTPPDPHASMSALFRELRTAHRGIEQRLSEQQTRLDALSASPSRPLLSRTTLPACPHKRAFIDYLRTGAEDGLRAHTLERKGLVSGADSSGGYFVDPQTAEGVAARLRGAGSIRSIARIVEVEQGPYEVLFDDADLASAWVSETDSLGITDSHAIRKIRIDLHELAAMPKVSQRLLDDAAFDIGSWLIERVGERFARAESAAFVTGTGANQPKGFLADNMAPSATKTLGIVESGADGDFPSMNQLDPILDLVYALGARYRQNAAFVMNSRVAARLRKFKDSDGRFLWADSLAAGAPSRLAGYPVLLCEDMPELSAGSFSMAFGDFRSGYVIAERPELRVLRDPFSQKPHVLFYATRRVGGAIVDYDAIKLMKFSA